MKNRQVTIKDIAKTLGISASTVSRALKDHPDISINTKNKVKELAETLNYKPNAIALKLFIIFFQRLSAVLKSMLPIKHIILLLHNQTNHQKKKF